MKMLTRGIARLLLAKPPCFCVVILIMSVICIWNMIINKQKLKIDEKINKIRKWLEISKTRLLTYK